MDHIFHNWRSVISRKTNDTNFSISKHKWRLFFYLLLCSYLFHKQSAHPPILLWSRFMLQKTGVRSDSCVFESVSYTYIKPTIICLAFLVTFCRFFQDARPEWFLVSHMILDRNLKDSLRCSRLIMLRLTPTGFDSSVEATKTIICLNRDTTPSRVTLLHFVKLS